MMSDENPKFLLTKEEVKQILGFEHLGMAKYLFSLKEQKNILEDKINKSSELTKQIIKEINNIEEKHKNSLNALKSQINKQHNKTNELIKAVLKYSKENQITGMEELVLLIINKG